MKAETKNKIVAGLIAGALLTLTGLVYGNLNDRVRENHDDVRSIIPILYEIKAQVERNGEDIQKLLECEENPTE